MYASGGPRRCHRYVDLLGSSTLGPRGNIGVAIHHRLSEAWKRSSFRSSVVIDHMTTLKVVVMVSNLVNRWIAAVGADAVRRESVLLLQIVNLRGGCSVLPL